MKPHPRIMVNLLANITVNSLYAMHYSKHFTCTNLLKPRSSFIGEKFIVMPIVQIKWWGNNWLSNLQAYSANDHKTISWS